MFEVIDKIFSLDMGDRGVGHLYEPAAVRLSGAQPE